MSEGPSVVVPLLNSYKLGLLRRRLFQTILGGARVRKVPWHVYLVQAVLWVFPLCLSIPFIALDAVNVWSKYLLALIYAICMGVVVLIEGLTVYTLRLRQRATNLNPSEFDDEKDEIETLTCCGTGYIAFVFSPKSLFSVLFHPFVSGVFTYAGFFLLLPNVLQESLPIAGVVVVSLFGWYAFCSAHYSLSTRAPPQTAIYRPTDPLQLKFLYRPFYILIIGSIFIPLRRWTTIPSLYFQLLYACLCLLPLGWVVGVLPPLDALFPWILEQALVKLLGGSQMATDVRLLIAFIASVVATAIVVPLNDVLIFVMLATTFGFLLSHNIFSHFKALLCLLSTKRNNRISRCLYSSADSVFSKTFVSYTGLGSARLMLGFRSYFTSVVFSVVKGSVVLAGSLVCVYYTSTVQDMETRKLLTEIFAGTVIGLYGVVVISDSIQRPYFLGVIRNWVFPKYPRHKSRRRRRLHWASLPRRVIVFFVSPLMMLALVGADVNREVTVPLLWQRIITARLLRATWQNTVSTLQELATVSILVLALPEDSSWISLGLPMQAFIVGVTLDALKDLLEKMTFVLISLIAFILNRKHRTYSVLNIMIIAGSVVLSPLLAGIILISSVLSAPLLSLFTLPIFSVSFPRTRHFWPGLVNYGSTYMKSTEETVYYQQAETEIARAIHSSISCGAVSAQPGMNVLIRFDNRLALITILEVGRGFCTISIRGLELQETSCHSEEATQIDDMYEAQHSPKSWQQLWFNTNLLSMLQPLDTLKIKTYSDARNVLTGIIDQPSALQRFSGNLIKSLVWVFYRYLKSTSTITITGVPQENNLANLDHTPSVHNAGSGLVLEEVESRRKSSQNTPRHSSVGFNDAKSHLNTFICDAGSWSSLSLDMPAPTPPMGAQRLSATPSWHDCVSSGLIPQDIPLDRKESVLHAAHGRNQLDTILPPLLRGEKTHLPKNKVLPECLSEMDMLFKGWQPPSLNHVQLYRLMKHFPHDWLTHLNDKSPMDGAPFELLSRTVVGCFSLLDVPAQASLIQQNAGSLLPSTYPLDVYRRFCNEIPYSLHLNWMTDQPQIHKLALKSYRYAVKLMYDECCLGEAENWDELADYFEDYEKNWCIVRESEEAWKSAILANAPHLFALGHDQVKDTYTAHVLSLQDEVVHIGSLNRAALEGLWADLALELVYLTNDDDERYSIQAHTHLLRNISIQAAEPPMGYSVYASGLLTIPLT